ncbi:MAG: TRAP transporter permease [Rhodospirillales bacterium]
MSETSRQRDLSGPVGNTVTVIAVLGACYHLYVLGFAPNDPWLHRVVHLMIAATLVFCLIPARKTAPDRRPSVVDLGLIGSLLLVTCYIFFYFEDLLGRLGVIPEDMDVVIATIAVLIVIEMSRRLHGWILPCIALFFILYTLFGSELPGLLGHRGYSYERTMTFLISSEGIYGPALAASATFVTLFVLFGAFLNHSGAGQFFVDLSYAASGGSRGGPAKVAVLASAFFGSISGSAVSNAVTTGTFTIPLMRAVGYKASFAAAVEAVASAGGQLMPPVMSATAFVMSEITSIPYLSIALAATVPSALYFLAVYFMIDYEAKNLKLTGIPKSELPDLGVVLRERGHLLIPVFVIIFALLVLQTSPLKAALYGILSVIIVGAFRQSSRLSPLKSALALGDGMKGMMDIATSCALAGIVVGVFSLTGLGLKFATALIAFSGGQLWLALLLTMVVCLVLGMGLPTIAAYVITAAAVAPGLIELGVPVLAAHMFILYFAAISTITPPVAITVFATAGLAGEPPMRVGFAAVKLGIAAYIVPFMFVYSSALLLVGSVTDILLAVPTALIGIWALSRGIQDHSCARLARLLLIIAAIVLIKPGLYTDIAGVLLIATAILADRWLARSV